MTNSKKTNQLKLNYDTFSILTDYLDIDSIINILLTSKSNYDTYYKYSKKYTSRIFIKKIIKYFLEYEYKISIDDDKYDDHIRKLFKFYKYFKHHANSSYSDYLIFIVENNDSRDTSFNTMLFELIISKCTFDISSNNQTRIEIYKNISKTKISFQDMIYICTYAQIEQLCIIMKLFCIPSSILFYIINSNHNKDKIDKITKCIDYLFYKHYFGNFNNIDSMYFHQIIYHFIQYNKIDIVEYIFQKKTFYKFSNIDYQLLIDNCIKNDNLPMLNIIFNNANIDNARIIITHFNIKYLCQRGSFYCLGWIIDNMLGNLINANGYIKSICEGIYILMKNKSLYNKYISEIKHLKKYLSQDNKIIINNFIDNKIYLE
jgi:hypothetical protein